MDCQKIQDYFSAYLDGELSESQRESVSSHLAVCSQCRREYEAWCRLWEALAAEQVRAPADLADRVLTRLPSRCRSWWPSLALAASLVVGIFLGSQLGMSLHEVANPQGLNGSQVAWEEELEAIPSQSLGAMLASYDPDNGNSL
ncbi:zf-HC2 domain-containing protein [Desulfobacca acetoxidans]